MRILIKCEWFERPVEWVRLSLLWSVLFALVLGRGAEAASSPLTDQSACERREFWLSPKGSDVNSGDETSPFKTLARARKALRAVKGGIAYLRDGVYKIDRTLALDGLDSGSAYVAAPGAHPILDGGLVVTNFSQNADGTWSACVSGSYPFEHCGFGVARSSDPRITDLYRNGELMRPAREPNEGFFRIAEVVDGSNYVFRSSDFQVDRIKDEKGAFATGYWKYFWADQTFAILADPQQDALKLITTSLSRDFYPLKNGHNFYISNLRQALDRRDEWHFDRQRGIITVIEPKGELVLASFGAPFITLTRADNIRIEGLTFRYGRTHAVVAKQCHGFVFRDNLVHGFGGWGLRADDMTNARVERTVFRTFGHGAARLTGGNRHTLTPSECVFQDNDVSDTGHAQRTYSHGLSIGGVAVTVVHNHFHDMPSSALCIPGNDHLIASNLIERVVLESDDQGGIDVFGNPAYQGTRIVHNIWRNFGCGGEWVPCGQAGVRFDDRISGMFVYGNRFENCSNGGFGGVQIHAGRENVIVNNIFVGCRYALSLTTWPQHQWLYSWKTNNPVLDSYDNGSPIWKNRYGDLSRLRDMPMINTFTNNVVIGAERLVYERGTGQATTITNGNHVFSIGAKPDFSLLSGFAPLPNESDIGIRNVQQKKKQGG